MDKMDMIHQYWTIAGYVLYIISVILLKRIYFQNIKWRYYTVGTLLPFIIAGIGVGLLICREDTLYASGYSEQAFQKVTKGMTQNDVYHLLGTPLEAYIFTKERCTVFLVKKEEKAEWSDLNKQPVSKDQIQRIYWHYSKQGNPTSNYYERYVVFSSEKTVMEIGEDYYID